MAEKAEKMEDKTEEKKKIEENGNRKEKEIKKADWLIFKLEKPVDYQQIHLETLDLSNLRNLNLDDMMEIYTIHAALGGEGTVMQEASLLFAKISAHKVTGLPLELFGQLSAKDAVKLKNRMYRFFYLEE